MTEYIALDLTAYSIKAIIISKDKSIAENKLKEYELEHSKEWEVKHELIVVPYKGEIK